GRVTCGFAEAVPKRTHVKRRMCCRKCDRRGASGGDLVALLQRAVCGRQGGRRFPCGAAGARRALARARRRTAAELNMRELVRTNDAVLITAIEALLEGARIKHLVVDRNMSVLEGSIGIFPRRILVDEEQFDAARRLLEEAGFADELRPDGR